MSGSGFAPLVCLAGSRRWLEVSVTRLTLYGGLAASFALTCCSIVLWVMARPGVADDVLLTKALYYVSFGFGGFGYSVPLALLMSGVSVPLLFHRVLPKWIPILGLIVAGFGVVSWLSLEFAPAMFFIPLTRFPGSYG